MLVAADESREDRHEGLLDHVAAVRGPRLIPFGGEVGTNPLDAPGRVVRRFRRVEGRKQVPRVEREKNGVGLEPVERRAAVNQFLSILSISGNVGRDPQTSSQARHAYRGQKMVNGRGSEHREPNRFRLQPGRWRSAEQAKQTTVETTGVDEIQRSQ